MPASLRRCCAKARARWGTGAVLNTSFNIHGEPIVCTPEEAIDVFLRSGADALAMGPFLVERPVADRAGHAAFAHVTLNRWAGRRLGVAHRDRRAR